MQDYPHHYHVRACAGPRGRVDLHADGLPPLETDAAAAHGGPGDAWSPAALLVAAALDCFALAFRIVAEASRQDFVRLECVARGSVDRAPEGARLVALRLEAELELPAGARIERGERLLRKAESRCVVTHSLIAPVELVTRVTCAS